MADRPGRDREFWLTTAVFLVAVVLVTVALFLFPSSPAGPNPADRVTIDSINWTIEQGNFSTGTPWYGVEWVNQSGSAFGFPLVVLPGASFNDTIVLVVAGAEDTPLCWVNVSAPLTVVGTDPGLPAPAPGGGSLPLSIQIAATAPAGTAVNATGVIDAIGC